MAQKRYEISDEQWNQIKDVFPIAKLDVFQLIIGLCSMQSYGSHEAEPNGVTYQNALVHGKQCIVVFANGVMTVLYYPFTRGFLYNSIQIKCTESMAL